MTHKTPYRKFEFDETLGHFLGDIRRQRGISAQYIADILGLSVQELNQIEYNGGALSAFQARQYADSMGISIAQFFDNGAPPLELRVLDHEYLITLLAHFAEKIGKMERLLTESKP